MKNFKKNYKDKSQGFILWSVDFSKRLILVLTILYILICIYAMVSPCFGITISDVFIEKSTDTFKVMVGTYLVKSVLENIFQYNDFSFSKSNGEFYDENIENNDNLDEEEVDNG